MERDINMS
jgi:archaellum component FlaC